MSRVHRTRDDHHLAVILQFTLQHIPLIHVRASCHLEVPGRSCRSFPNKINLIVVTVE